MTGGIYFMTAGNSGPHLDRVRDENVRLNRVTRQSAHVGILENSLRTSAG